MTEYDLFPIKKKDVNWPLYWMVAGFLKYKDGIDAIPYDDLFESLRDDKEVDNREYFYSFVFPSEDLSISYAEEMLTQEALILKRFMPIGHVSGEPFITIDDNCVKPEDIWYENVTIEYFYWDDSEPDPSIRHAGTDIVDDHPKWAFNGDDFMDALDKLLAFLQEKHLTGIPWFERLKTVKRMFDGQANELHILHNAGLFDNDTLWIELEEVGASQAEIERIKTRYISELKKYAMFVLNQLDWNFGTVVGEDDREKRRYLFEPIDSEQLKKNEAERKRRLQMMSERQQQNRPPKAPTKIPKLAPKGETPTKTQIKIQPKTKANTQSKSTIGCPELLDFGRQVLEGILDLLRTREGAKTDTTITPNKKLLLRNAFIMIMVALVSIALYLVIGPIIGVDPDKAGEIQWAIGVLVLMAAMRLTIISNGYKHLHSFRFRCFRLVLGVALTFLFYYTGLWFMRTIRFLAPPTQTYIIIQSIGLTSIVLATINRHCVPDERQARPYSLWIITAVAALIGNFFSTIYAMR